MAVSDETLAEVVKLTREAARAGKDTIKRLEPLAGRVTVLEAKDATAEARIAAAEAKIAALERGMAALFFALAHKLLDTVIGSPWVQRGIGVAIMLAAGVITYRLAPAVLDTLSLSLGGPNVPAAKP